MVDDQVADEQVPALTEGVLTDGARARDARVTSTYDAVAAEYADGLLDELDAKPLDRWLLARLAALADGGPVADVGCGPGQVAAHVAGEGAEVTGFDLSPGMVAEARRRFPDLTFAVGDLTDLPPEPGGWAVITAWYSLVHLAGSELASTTEALRRVLRPGGWLAVALHVGPATLHVDTWFGHGVDLDFTMHDPAVVLDAFRAAGLTEVEWYQRGPYQRGAETTERLYVLGRRPT